MEFAGGCKGDAARDLVLAVQTVLSGGTFFPGKNPVRIDWGLSGELQEWQTLAVMGVTSVCRCSPSRWVFH